MSGKVVVDKISYVKIGLYDYRLIERINYTRRAANIEMGGPSRAKAALSIQVQYTEDMLMCKL